MTRSFLADDDLTPAEQAEVQRLRGGEVVGDVVVVDDVAEVLEQALARSEQQDGGDVAQAASSVASRP